jgi:hypothetical protein
MKIAEVGMLGLFVAVALGQVSCGEELTDESYQGEPRFVVEGAIQSLDAVSAPAETFVAVYWDNWARNGDTANTQLAAVADQSFPTQFTLALYDAPALDALNDFTDPPEGISGYLGTGYVTVFDDLDSDGVADVADDDDPNGDTLRGFSATHVVLYAQDLNDAARAHLADSGLILNPEALQSGYNLARFVCATDPDDFDHLLVVPSEAVTIEATDVAETSDCLDFH